MADMSQEGEYPGHCDSLASVTSEFLGEVLRVGSGLIQAPRIAPIGESQRLPVVPDLHRLGSLRVTAFGFRFRLDY